MTAVKGRVEEHKEVTGDSQEDSVLVSNMEAQATEVQRVRRIVNSKLDPSFAF